MRRILAKIDEYVLGSKIFCLPDQNKPTKKAAMEVEYKASVSSHTLTFLNKFRRNPRNIFSSFSCPDIHDS